MPRSRGGGYDGTRAWGGAVGIVSLCLAAWLNAVNYIKKREALVLEWLCTRATLQIFIKASFKNGGILV